MCRVELWWWGGAVVCEGGAVVCEGGAVVVGVELWCVTM